MIKRSKKILVVDDDPVLIKVLVNILKNAGFAVDHAVNGEEALTKIGRHDYGLILLDLIMPRVSGMEVLQSMKEAKNTTPVLVFSNLSQSENKAEAINLGARGYYVKSDMSVKEVIAVVRKFLRTC